MKILNLGCGTKVSPHPDVVNIDWSILLRIRSNFLLRAVAPILLNGDRLRRFNSLPNNLMVHDLSRGIPFPANSVDVVYHSHVLEHLDRGIAKEFVAECARVLRPGGIIRIAVPDYERYCRTYLEHVELCAVDGGHATIADHDALFEPLLKMSVLREAHGTSTQRPLRRFIENLLLGDARKRGETHQWMYDRFNLSWLLQSCGFIQPAVRTFDTSNIPDWLNLRLDCDDAGDEYKPESLYMEAVKVSM
ncbi:class I SAM-dependent methyltransferase [Nevskia soli]|uniref:class I SAM-dependent methyltransferase n=1 Tax=Nevskia soli TaxID=418856 RepID=UPI001B8034D2|nr:class I SAM-dependent methyltransferase [Nevskia soli]